MHALIENNKMGKMTKSVRARIEVAFDSCALYTFVGDMITRTLSSGESHSKLVEELKKYKCQDSSLQ